MSKGSLYRFLAQEIGLTGSFAIFLGFFFSQTQQKDTLLHLLKREYNIMLIIVSSKYDMMT
jgi:hypothetical protein